MKPAAGSRFGRNRFRIVYVNRFGNHHCGTVIHYGGGGSGGHLSHEGKVAPANTSSCIPNKALSPISHGTGSGCAAFPPSPIGQKSPCFVPGASSKLADGNGICGSQPLHREGRAKSPKVARAKKITAASPCSLNKDQSCERAAVSSTASSSQKQIGGCQVTQGAVFEFHTPLENANSMIRKHKKKSAVWRGVSKVIFKMIEENGHFRNRLIHCSQLSSEGRDVNENTASGASCIDTDEAIFGWV